MMQTSARLRLILALAISAMTIACGGTNTPFGPVVGSPGGGDPPPLRLVNVRLTVTIPPSKSGLRADYLSPKTRSLAIALVSVDGNGVTGINPTTVNTVASAHGCKAQGRQLVCSATISGSPGHDVFAVSTYAELDATGDVLSVGTVKAAVSSGGGGVGISNRLSLALDGVIASLKVTLDPDKGKRGRRMTCHVTLAAYDGAGAEIVGPSDYFEPVTLAIQGDTNHAFRLSDGKRLGESLSIVKPTAGITLAYDGNKQASPVAVQAGIAGPSGITTSADFKLTGKVPPPPVGTIYALNLGTNDGRSATVTEYDGKSQGNAARARTLSLSSKLYARSIAVDSSGDLYVGYFDNEYGFSAGTGLPDSHNEIAIYAPGAGGNAQPKATIVADNKTKTTLFPLFIAFDSTGRLVTYGATDVDKNTGDAVLTYAAGSTGPAAPQHGWNFYDPAIEYAGPTGLALDSGGNFYVNGALHTSIGPNYGLFVASAADIGNPDANAARTIPWDSTTQLEQGQTTEVALGSSGEIFIGNTVTQGSGSSTSCQARVNVFAAGAGGGKTDGRPLRVLTLDGISTDNSECTSSRDPLVPFYPAIALYGPTLFVADDFNNAIAAFASDASGTVKPSLRIAGSATELNAPVALVVTSHAPHSH
ncbi:MAG TPA: hypothetical protein VKR56_03755 [Candidatus Cybelea sp.]|nr:hypothetical protein [Candidatus Cybelea sp.]